MLFLKGIITVKNYAINAQWKKFQVHFYSAINATYERYKRQWKHTVRVLKHLAGNPFA